MPRLGAIVLGSNPNSEVKTIKMININPNLKFANFMFADLFRFFEIINIT